jgi:response regulator NasT
MTLHVVAADPHRDLLEFYRAALPRMGHRVQVVRTGPELVEACRLLSPDLILTAADLGGSDGIVAADAVCRERPVPVVLVADTFDSACLARVLASDSVMGCLTRPVGEAILGAAIVVAAHRFEQLRVLRANVTDLRQALEDRKVVERAKGAVCRRVGLDENEAYRRLRAVASNANRKLVDLARQVLEAEAVFREIDATRPPPGQNSHNT